MQKEIIMTAKTVDEALKRAYEEMGATSDETGFEILQMPRKGFFGLKITPAKVRVYRLEEEEPRQAPAAPAPPAPQEKRPERKHEPQRPQEEGKGPAPAQRNPSPPRPAAGGSERRAMPQPWPGGGPAAPEKRDAAPRQEHPAQALPLTPKADLAVSYIKDILENLGVRGAVVTATQTRESIDILLEGEGLGVIIGRRGETLDAVQYLTSLVANRLDGDYMRISIDSGDYRKKRAETLERLATKLARNAVKTGRSTKLEPMNPYERRIIHAAVSKVEGAMSSSVGEEPNRRVVISAKVPRKRPDMPPREGGRPPREAGRSRGPRGAGRDRRPDPRGPRPGGREKLPVEKIRDNELEIPHDLAPKELAPPPPAKTKKEEPGNTPSEMEKDVMPLYGKLDL